MLHIEYTGVANWETVCVVDAGPDDWRHTNVSEDGKKMNPVTQALGFIAMIIDLGEITQANARQWYERIYAYERGAGAMLREFPDDDGPTRDHYLTPGDVIAHIGLRVNVAPRTDAQFARKLAQILRDRARDVWREHERETAEAATVTTAA